MRAIVRLCNCHLAGSCKMTQSVVVAAVTVAACACVGVLGMLTYMVANNNQPSRRDDDQDDPPTAEPAQRSRSRRVSSATAPPSEHRNDRWLKSQLKQISHKGDMGVQGYASMEDVITRNADVAMQLEQLEVTATITHHPLACANQPAYSPGKYSKGSKRVTHASGWGPRLTKS